MIESEVTAVPVSADNTILGVVGWYPCSGYDMKVEFEKGGAGLLSALSFGSIYPRLRALEREGLIETYEVSTDGRRKKLHELTARGWEALSEWLAEAPEYPIPMRDELLLKMIFWVAGRPDDRETLIDHLELRRDQSLELLEYIDGWTHNGVSMVDEYGMLVLDYTRRRLQVELDWIESTIAQLQGPPRPPAQDPNDLIPRMRERHEAAVRATDGRRVASDE